MAKTVDVKRQATIDKARARRFAMQAVYQVLLSDCSANEAIRDLYEREGQQFDTDFFEELVGSVIDNQANLELQTTPLLDRKIKDLDKVEHAILLVGAYEINSQLTPVAVAINEAVVLAKKFGGQDSHKFINGVLDKLAKQIKSAR